MPPKYARVLKIAAMIYPHVLATIGCAMLVWMAVSLNHMNKKGINLVGNVDASVDGKIFVEGLSNQR